MDIFFCKKVYYSGYSYALIYNMTTKPGRVEDKLEELKEFIKKSIDSYTPTNEVVMTARAENIKFLYVQKQECDSASDVLHLNALYMQKLFEKKFGIKLPIYEYNQTSPSFRLYQPVKHKLACEKMFLSDYSKSVLHLLDIDTPLPVKKKFDLHSLFMF